MSSGCRHWQHGQKDGNRCAVGADCSHPMRTCLLHPSVVCPQRQEWTAEERAESDRRFLAVVETVLPFAAKLKAKMIVDGRVVKPRVRTRCPRKDHADETKIHWIHAQIAGSRMHMHMACDDPACIMRMME